MSKLRHIAMQVPNLEEAANFYESVFEMERVGETESPVGNAISPITFPTAQSNCFLWVEVTRHKSAPILWLTAYREVW